MWEKILLATFGFLLSGVAGAYLGYVFKQRAWREEAHYSLHKARYDEGTRFLDELSELIGRRFFAALRFLWAIEAGKIEKIADRERDYFACVEVWNGLILAQPQQNSTIDK